MKTASVHQDNKKQIKTKSAPENQCTLSFCLTAELQGHNG